MQKKRRSRNDSNGHAGFRLRVTLDSISENKPKGLFPSVAGRSAAFPLKNIVLSTVFRSFKVFYLS